MSLNEDFIKELITAQNHKIDILCGKLGIDKSTLDQHVYFTREEILNHLYKNEKKIKIKKKFPEPCSFSNEYEYFVKISDLLKMKYYKYSTLQWQGPCIMLNTNLYSNDKIQKIKKKFNIELNLDYLSNNNIVLYPKKYIDPNCINYTDSVKTQQTIMKPKLELTEWVLDTKLFYLDSSTNNVYTEEDILYIGKREYKNGKWVITN